MLITEAENRIIDWFHNLTRMEQEALLLAAEEGDYTLLHRLQEGSELLRRFNGLMVADCQNEPFFFFG